MTQVHEYPSETPRRDGIVATLTIAFILGLPVAVGCVVYVLGGTKWESMLVGACFVVIPIMAMWAVACFQWNKMLRVHGRPLDSGDRVQVTCGPLEGREGVVKFPGQGGPMTLFVQLDDCSKDETYVFSWSQLRRLQ